MKRTTGHARPEAALECLAEIVSVLRKHGYTLGHEDSQGAFELEPRVPEDATSSWGDPWLLAANVLIYEPGEGQSG